MASHGTSHEHFQSKEKHADKFRRLSTVGDVGAQLHLIKKQWDLCDIDGGGEVTAGEIAAFFYVNIVDDPCTEVAEYVQLSLSIPGAPALQGEQFLARLRIDDDDFPELAKTELCADTGFL